ncbi:MAG: TOBE domain-containing protein, partial [Deinococcales bacterium]
GLEGATNISAGANKLTGQVEVVEPLGAETDLMVNVAGQSVVAKVEGHAQVKVGDVVTLYADQSKMHAFDLQTEMAIGR